MELPKTKDGKLVNVIAVDTPRQGILRIMWDDDVELDVDIMDTFDGHPLLEALNDPAVFETATVGEFGGIEWANGIDMCPQALRIRANEQNAAQITAAE